MDLRQTQVSWLHLSSVYWTLISKNQGKYVVVSESLPGLRRYRMPLRGLLLTLFLSCVVLVVVRRRREECVSVLVVEPSVVLGLEDLLLAELFGANSYLWV